MPLWASASFSYICYLLLALLHRLKYARLKQKVCAKAQGFINIWGISLLLLAFIREGTAP
jgi:hypothetical protein